MIPQGFLDAILSDPGDDTPRMVLADWLEENGEPERAEFIRVQCQLALSDSLLTPGKGRALWPLFCETEAKREVLRQREQELLTKNLRAWFDLPSLGDRRPSWRCENIDSTQISHDARFSYRRGFISSITCAAADWLAHADALTASQPIEAVMLTTWPAVEISRANAPFIVRLSGRKRTEVADSENSNDLRWAIEQLLRFEWPRITFTLPRSMPFDGNATWGESHSSPLDDFHAVEAAQQVILEQLD